MFKLDKVFEILDQEKREIFISRENGDLAVMMSLDKYQELKSKSNNKIEVEDDNSDNLLDYSMQVRKSIMKNS